MVKALYQHYLDMRTDLKPYEVDVPDEYKRGVLNRVYPKQCFDKAFDYMKKNGELAELKYVEGVYGGGLLADHAWVEIGDSVVFDGTLQRFYDKEKYYDKRQAFKLVELSYKAMWEYLYQDMIGNGKPLFWKAKREYLETLGLYESFIEV